jgi:hypothetical protein
MRRLHRFIPSPAMVVACLALLVALGGVSYAATLPRNSVGTAQLKKNAVTSIKVKDRSLLASDFKRGQLPRGPRGLRGLTGATGAKGDKGDAGPVGQIQGAAAGGDLTGTYPNPTIGAGKVTSSAIFDGTIAAPDLAASLSDAAAATPSLRSLGTGANQAVAGNDARLSDARTPTGAAGGALAGTYPNPTLAAPAAFISLGFADALPGCEGGAATNTWQDRSPNVNNEVAYQRDPFGVVHLRGIAQRCGTVTNPIFTLPPGYRPGRSEIQAVAHSDGTTISQVNIGSDGTVSTWGTEPAAGEWISLDGITFRCAPAGSGCP